MQKLANLLSNVVRGITTAAFKLMQLPSSVALTFISLTCMNAAQPPYCLHFQDRIVSSCPRGRCTSPFGFRFRAGTASTLQWLRWQRVIAAVIHLDETISRLQL
eukprot:jgi/Botrbrau1/6659/Bobra.0202s0007.1